MTTKITIGEIVRTARKARKWSANMLARKCGVRQETILRFERGQANDMVVKAIRILAALGVDLKQISTAISGKPRLPISFGDGMECDRLSRIQTGQTIDRRDIIDIRNLIHDHTEALERQADIIAIAARMATIGWVAPDESRPRN